MKRLFALAVSVILIILAFASCKQWSSTSQRGPAQDMALARLSAPPPPAPMALEAGAAPEGEGGSPQASSIPSERKLMRSASLEIEVGDLEKARRETQAIVEKAQGFIANTSSYEDNAGQKALAISIRVPAQKLDDSITAIKAIGRVKEERVGAEDVTEQYIDLEARLANSKRLEQRLLALLESKASRLKDLLDTERELARVRTDIETMEGRKRFLDNRISLSTINVTFTEPRGFGRGIFAPLAGSFQRALAAFTGSLATLIVVVSALVPWIILVIFAIWILARFVRIRRRKKEMKNQAGKDKSPA